MNAVCCSEKACSGKLSPKSHPCGRKDLLPCMPTPKPLTTLYPGWAAAVHVILCQRHSPPCPSAMGAVPAGTAVAVALSDAELVALRAALKEAQLEAQLLQSENQSLQDIASAYKSHLK